MKRILQKLSGPPACFYCRKPAECERGGRTVCSKCVEEEELTGPIYPLRKPTPRPLYSAWEELHLAAQLNAKWNAYTDTRVR